jgi:hypothetical protein
MPNMPDSLPDATPGSRARLIDLANEFFGSDDVVMPMNSSPPRNLGESKSTWPELYTLNLIPSFGACTKSCLVPRYRSVV